jgi:response regulator RpfG family c-di-GMP phosphodiesterase
MKVLAVDDNAVNLRVYEHTITQRLGCEVESFTSPSEALQRALTPDIDLVIVDYLMPDMDDLEFIRRLRAIIGQETIPVLMITSTTERDIRYKALELGTNDFLIKPVDSAELTARVKNLLALRTAHVKLANTADWLATQVSIATADIAAREREAIFRLSRAAEFRDPDTGMHIVRMANYSMAIAVGLSLPTHQQEELLTAAPMHDIGKVAIADDILLKPGKLTKDEFEAMKRHTTIGHEILKDSPARLLQAAAEIALTHHERWDGSGYPQGLAGDAIPLAGRICALSDVFDALTSDRPYKAAWSLEEALAEIDRGTGAHFDRRVVAAFKDVMPEILRIYESYNDRPVRQLHSIGANPASDISRSGGVG